MRGDQAGGWAAVQREGDHNRLESGDGLEKLSKWTGQALALLEYGGRERSTEALTLPVGGNVGPIWGAGVSG